MRLTVVLGTSGDVSFDILLNDNAFVRKWTEELRWCLVNCEFNQQEAFAGFMSLNEAEKILEDACIIINKHLKNFIELRDDLSNQPQEYFNYLHSKFEQLSGGFGKSTKLFSIANRELKQAIRNLNSFLHRVETKRPIDNALYISFNKDQYRRWPLEFEDYQFFNFDAPAGTLFLHYAELGKDFVDLYEDGLSLNYRGFKNLHHYSGEASLRFEEYNGLSDKNYISWLTGNGIDPYNKLLGHGKIPLGHVEDLPSALKKLTTYKHIKEILIKE